MKIGIWDGSSDGMFGSLTIEPYGKENGNYYGNPYAITEIPEAKWGEWRQFVKTYCEWEAFWMAELINKNNRS